MCPNTGDGRQIWLKTTQSALWNANNAIGRDKIACNSAMEACKRVAYRLWRRDFLAGTR